jgi:hypothetical protein
VKIAAAFRRFIIIPFFVVSFSPVIQLRFYVVIQQLSPFFLCRSPVPSLIAVV